MNESHSQEPLVGVLVDDKRIQKLVSQDCSFRLYFWFEELFHANEEAKLTLYAFTTTNVDFDTGTVHGTFLNTSTGLWEQSEFPLPHFVYIRGVAAEQKEDLKILLTHFKEKSIKLLNAKYLFSKWHVYKKLKKQPQLRLYLPRTTRMRDETDLSRFFRTHDTIYIKAYYGSRGRNVMRVTQLPNGGYKYSRNHLGEMHCGTERDLTGLMQLIRKTYGSKSVVLQEAIDVIRVKNQNVDFRAEVQRNKFGELDVVAVIARIGEIDSPITTHADVMTFEQFWRVYFCYTDHQLNELNEKVTDFLKLIYQGIENAYGAFVDLGIDFAVDVNDNLRLIECNARSAKISFMRTSEPEILRKAFLNPLEYAKFLHTASEEQQMTNARSDLVSKEEQSSSDVGTSLPLVQLMDLSVGRTT